jgi:putative membrane protein
VHRNKWSTALLLSVGFVSALSISLFNPLPEASSLTYLFFSGALAICAMILPGISGSFILVLLGSYPTVLNAVHERNLSVLLVVGAGAIFGLLSFSKLLKWLFEHFKNATLTVLVGFIAGSLPKIWLSRRYSETINSILSFCFFFN